MKRRATASPNFQTVSTSSSKKSKPTMTSTIPQGHEEAFKHAWNALDNDDEKETLRAEQQYGDLENEVTAKLHVNPHDNRKAQLASLKQQATSQPEVQDPDYKGPHLPEHLTPESIQDMIKAFSNNILLHPVYAVRIFRLMKKHLKRNCHTINDIAIPENGRVTVVGDTHGQLTDVLTIFRIGGMPSLSNVYLFNGDYVDRGPQDVEVLLTIYGLALATPGSVYFNRGNHEQRHMNERYSFEDNMRAKYSSTMFELVQKSFKYLPLASIIEGKVYVTHGGLFPYEDVTIDEIRALDRRALKRGHAHDRVSTLLQCIIWSDPRTEDGWAKSDRGAGILWGPDITSKFLSTNKLELVIRSHQMVEHGLELLHDKRLITLFSASNYCGTNDNQGAIIVFSDRSNPTSYQSHSYFADLIAQSHSAERLRECKEQTLQQLRERIFHHRHALSLKFSELDKASSGELSVSEWVSALQTTLALPINWNVLWPYLAKAEKSGAINYTKFLDRYRIEVESKFWDAWLNSVTNKLCRKINLLGADIREAFEKIDRNGDKLISYQEFADIVKSFDVGLTQDQVYDLMRSVDSNKDGHIDYTEFVARFEGGFAIVVKDDEDRERREWLLENFRNISIALHKRYKKLSTAFASFDTNSSGKISYGEFTEALKKLDFDYSPGDMKLLLKHIDSNRSGEISKKEFKRALSPTVLDKDAGFYRGLLATICDAIRKSKVQLRRVFRHMDIDGDGTIDLGEFKAGLEALNVVLDTPLNDEQVKKLYSLVDTNSDGSISYEEFLESFRVVDSEAVESLDSVDASDSSRDH